MKISIINGSQKIGKSNTGIILNYLNNLIKEKYEVKNYNSGINDFTDETLKDIISGDVIVLAFPLFADSIPSQTLRMLVELEKIVKLNHVNNLIIYVIVNNGFYEGKQNHVAFEIMKNWCEHAGIQFGGGIGQGAGEMIGETQDIPINKGPFNNLGRALQAMVEKIEVKEPFGITYLSPYFPRFLWKFMAIRVWHTRARKNGINKRDIIRKL
jgi:multimeric flavodoxin WrbA